MPVLNTGHTSNKAPVEKIAAGKKRVEKETKKGKANFSKVLLKKLESVDKKSGKVNLLEKLKPGLRNEPGSKHKSGSKVKPGLEVKPGSRIKSGLEVKPGEKGSPSLKLKRDSKVKPGLKVEAAPTEAEKSAILPFPVDLVKASEKGIPEVDLPAAKKTKSKKQAVKIVVIDLRQNGPDISEKTAADPVRMKEMPENIIFIKTLPGADREGSGTGSAEQQLNAKSHTVLRSFQEVMIPEVVKNTSIILKNADQGEIRLVLRPESLGSVRIRISLNESIIEGRIIVENNTVKDLFEAGMDNLKAALQEEGFQASLDVSVGNHETGEKENRKYGMDEKMDEKMAEEIEKAVPQAYEYGELLIDLVV